MEEAKRAVDEKLEASRRAKEVWEARRKLSQESEDGLSQAEAKRNQVEIQLAHVETGLSALERELSERFGKTYSDLEPLNVSRRASRKGSEKEKASIWKAALK